MPKQTARVDVFYASLKIFYDSYKQNEEWVSNKDYKELIQKLLPDLSQGAQDGAFLVKQSELTRYFGFVYRDYNGKKSKITDRGIRFYNAYLNNDDTLQKELIMEAILNDSFGRNNTAIQNSDSNIDPPKLFLRALYDIKKISIKGFSYLLYITHDKEISYHDALLEWNDGNDCDREIPIDLSNKYSDVKFTKFLCEFKIVEFLQGEYYLSEFTKNHYDAKLSKLKIYNKQPDLVYSTQSFDVLEDENNQQEKIITSFAYDVMNPSFKKINNREPEPVKTKNGIKYKTNSRISKTALQLAEFKCAYDPENHKTFISKSGKPYMEAHHLIPMHAQKDFSINLDRIENIFSLCPICHSAIHLGDAPTRQNIMTNLLIERQDVLKECGIDISFGDLFNKYYK